MSLDARLRRLEGSVDRTPGQVEMEQWVRALEFDDLQCLLAIGDQTEIASTPPAGVTLDEARARVRALAAAAPESVRLLLLANCPRM